MNGIKELIMMSKFAGKRFDLTQAGGGNTSVKLDGHSMLIKSSGLPLSQVTTRKGFTKIEQGKVNKLLSLPYHSIESSYEALIKGKRERPSMEVFMHALIPYKCVLHTHPVTVNAVTCSKKWISLIKELFPRSIYVDYATPGIDLALRLSYLSRKMRIPEIIFLQNHGLIVSAESAEKAIQLTEMVADKINTALKIKAPKKSSRKMPAEVKGLLKGIPDKVFASKNNEVRLLTKRIPPNRMTPITPDMMIYCGYKPMFSDPKSILNNIGLYYKKFRMLPKVMMIKDKIMYIAKDKKAAKKIEDVLKAHLLVIDSISEHDLLPLPIRECFKLVRLRSEKYRMSR